MSLVAPTRRAQPSIPRECPAHPHTPSLHPYLGTFQPAFGPRALPLHVPARATHSMPSYPRHRASNFCSHTSTNPTRVHGGCDALPSVSRLSSSNHQTFAFPLSQKHARTKGKHADGAQSKDARSACIGA
jgi:hypothetical protein